MMNDTDLQLLRAAIVVARRAREHGNHPFGALLVGRDGQVLLEAENTVLSGPDCTGHAETNLMRLASRRYAADFLAECSLYTSTEPCPMCAGAIYWGSLARVVFALSQNKFYDFIGGPAEGLRLSCQEVFGHGPRAIEVLGPALEEAALEVHRGFWESH